MQELKSTKHVSKTPTATSYLRLKTISSTLKPYRYFLLHSLSIDLLCLTLKCQVLLSSLRSVEALGEDAKGVPALPSDNSANSASLNTTTSSAGDRRSMHTEMLEQLLLAPVKERDGRELGGRLARPPTSPPLPYNQRAASSPLPYHQRASTSPPLPYHQRAPTSPLPYQRAPTSPLSVAASSGHFSATPSPGSELLARLRSEVDLLREERQAASERWARERRALERQLLEARDGGREAERRRSVEEQLRDILTVVRSLNSMVGMTLYQLQRKR